MGFKYERKINYYETDKMGIVHHSNYIRFLEEARCAWMESIDMPFDNMEENGFTIPVLAVNCQYKTHVTFGDTIVIEPHVKEYNGVRLTVEYDVTNVENGRTVIIAETKHCFTGNDLRPVNLKKKAPKFSDKFQMLLEENEGWVRDGC